MSLENLFSRWRESGDPWPGLLNLRDYATNQVQVENLFSRWRESGDPWPGLVNLRDYATSNQAQDSGALSFSPQLYEPDQPTSLSETFAGFGGRFARPGESGSRKAQPETTTGDLIGGDKPLRQIGRDVADSVSSRIDDAIAILQSGGKTITSNIQGMIDEITGSLPRFTDEERKGQIKFESDQITAAIQDLLNESSVAATSRGFLGGGQLSSAAAELQGLGISEKAKAVRDITEQQRQFNLQAGALEEGYAAPLRELSARLQSNFTLAEAELERSGLISDQTIWSIATDLDAIERADEQFNQILKLAEEGAETLDPSIFETIASVAGTYGQYTGADNIQAFAAMAQFLPDLAEFIPGRS